MGSSCERGFYLAPQVVCGCCPSTAASNKPLLSHTHQMLFDVTDVLMAVMHSRASSSLLYSDTYPACIYAGVDLIWFDGARCCDINTKI
jgi:hypothetical protein